MFLCVTWFSKKNSLPPWRIFNFRNQWNFGSQSHCGGYSLPRIFPYKIYDTFCIFNSQFFLESPTAKERKGNDLVFSVILQLDEICLLSICNLVTLQASIYWGAIFQQFASMSSTRVGLSKRANVIMHSMPHLHCQKH